MPRINLLATGTMLLFALTTAAQQTITKPVVPTAAEQLKVLTSKLDLTADQQAKFKPILQDLQDATERIVQDTSLSHDQQLAKVRPWRYKTDKRMREVLNNDQKRKLDQYEQGPHPEMHGSLQ